MGRVVVTGATGFVGTHLLGRLQGNNWEVIGATRNPERARKARSDIPWVRLDLDIPETIVPALEGVTAAFYLVHGMADGGDYRTRERQGAERFAEAAAKAGLERIIYLGGVSPGGDVRSKHLQSRLATGEILRSGSVPAFELRAGMIVGSGSESWCIVRDLSARLPVMILPRWLNTRSQPVSITDVAAALRCALDLPTIEAGCYDIPGPDMLTAKEVLLRISRLRGTRPVTVDVPFVSPRLSSYWIQWVTRASGSVSRELVEGLRTDLVSTMPSFWRHMPEHRLLSFDDAARAALQQDRHGLSLRARALERFAKEVSPKA